MSDKWPTLSPREYKKLERAGINSCDEFIGLVRFYKLWEVSTRQGLHYVFAINDAPIRTAGPTTWARYIAMFEHVGFPWQHHVIQSHQDKLRNLQDFRLELNRKVDQLIDLLKAFQEIA